MKLVTRVILHLCLIFMTFLHSGCHRIKNLLYPQPRSRLQAIPRRHEPEKPQLTLLQLENAPYHTSVGTMMLKKGIGSVRGRTTSFQMAGFGDLNGNGLQDAAVILSSSLGGTGRFVDLAAVLNQKGKPENMDTIPLGDRVEVGRVLIRDQNIFLDITVHEKGDPACCPTYQETMRFKLLDDRLVLVQGKPDSR